MNTKLEKNEKKIHNDYDTSKQGSRNFCLVPKGALTSPTGARSSSNDDTSAGPRVEVGYSQLPYFGQPHRCPTDETIDWSTSLRYSIDGILHFVCCYLRWKVPATRYRMNCHCLGCNVTKRKGCLLLLMKASSILGMFVRYLQVFACSTNRRSSC